MLPSAPNRRTSDGLPIRRGHPMTDETRQFFHDLKKMFTSKSLLQHFNSKLIINIKLNLLNFVISFILFQLHDDKWRSITFWWKTKTAAEKNYDINETEMLAIVKTCKKWKNYVKFFYISFLLLLIMQIFVFFLQIKILTAKKHDDEKNFQNSIS